MSLSQTARVYQLEHGHNMTATVTHDSQTQRFKYGLINATMGRTTYVHGIDGNTKQAEIETVEFVNLQSGDKIELADGRKGNVDNTSQSILNDRQTLFVPYAKVEKITRITIKYL